MYNYPDLMPNSAYVKYLFSRDTNILSMVSGSMDKLGDTFCLKFPFNKDKFIVSKDVGMAEYILKKNQTNYNKSYLSTEGMGLYLGNSINLRNGEDWLRQRKLMQPSFTKKSIGNLVGLMKEEIYDFMEEVPMDKEVDFYEMMHKLVFRIIIRSLFSSGYEIKELFKISDLLLEAQEMCSKEVTQPYMKWWYGITGKRARTLSNLQVIRDMLNDLIEARIQSGEKKDDVLSMLLDSKYEDTGESMGRDDLISEILFLIIAGHETTANSLSWSISLLSHHQDEREKLIAEITQLSDKFLDWDGLLSSSHTMNVINESMRLFPPVWVLDRASIEDDSFGDFSWKGNTTFILYVYGMHRDEANWDRPNDFIPDRFNRVDLRKKPLYPFGGGPRMCLGNHFSIVEMILVLRILYKNYDVAMVHDFPKQAPFVTLRPDRVKGVLSPKE